MEFRALRKHVERVGFPPSHLLVASPGEGPPLVARSLPSCAKKGGPRRCGEGESPHLVVVRGGSPALWQGERGVPNLWQGQGGLPSCHLIS